MGQENLAGLPFVEAGEELFDFFALPEAIEPRSARTPESEHLGEHADVSRGTAAGEHHGTLRANPFINASVAYVLKRWPRCRSNPSTARISVMFPSLINSISYIPGRRCLRATLTTRRRFARMITFFARRRIQVPLEELQVAITGELGLELAPRVDELELVEVKFQERAARMGGKQGRPVKVPEIRRQVPRDRESLRGTAVGHKSFWHGDRRDGLSRVVAVIQRDRR